MQYFLNKELLQTHLVKSEISRLDKLLLILFLEAESPKSQSEIKNIASQNGLRECIKWNVSDILSKSNGKATSIKGKWLITVPGRNYLMTQKLLDVKNSRTKND